MGWKPIRAVPEFDHNRTKFPLRGMHISVTCTECHTKSVFANTGTRCADCHADIHKRQLGPNCEQCHTVKGWKVQIEQVKQHNNRMPLIGAHAAVDCDSCHKSGALSQYSTMSVDCYSCHAKDYNSAKNPDHQAGKFPTNCQQCHNFNNWLNASFDHSTTGFPLTGMHTVPPRQCVDCHKNGNYNITDTSCVSCHLNDFNGSKNPNHVQLGFSQQCEGCHTTSGWSPANFDHSKSGFPLTGKHTVPPRQCTDCHVNNNYNITDTTCVSCHLKDYQNTNNPNHVQQNFPQTCETCHTTSGWSPANFDHSKSGFPLTGKHQVPPRQCTDCHVNNNYNITDTSCVSCHQNDYNNAKSPVDHPGAHFPTTCESCHDTVDWMNGKFDHSSTGWTLTGKHTVPPRQCTDCHINGNYNITDTSCVSCHQNDYNNAKSPVDHIGAHFPTNCAPCHDTVDWMNGKFDHSSTGWALTGNHQVPPRQCTDCHVNNNYNITDTTCVSCHQNDYNNAKSPVDHVGGHFPTNCAPCHDTVDWMNGKFDHSSTGWALTGKHTVPPRECTDCHVNNNYNITDTTCVSCHQNDYNQAKSPVDHVGAHFPTTCENCHDTVDWMNGKFDHSSTGWTLTGKHTVPPRACTDCHVNGNYNITDTTCVSCHLNDYNNAKSPVDHPGAHFPTTCESCHDTVDWMNGKFDHSSTGWTLTGKHTVPPRACTDCHVNNNYNITDTSCVSCHLNDYNNAKSPVDHVGAHFPTNCAPCHDTVDWMNGKFDHSSTGWTLTGKHTVPPRQCTDCHVNNNYNITDTTCVSCHLNDYNNAKSPVDHPGAHFPTTCESCHDTVDWMNGKFDHSKTGWTLTGKHTVPPRACTDCHVNNNYNLKDTSCVSCHLNDYNNAKSPVDHIAAKLPTTCELCHDTVDWMNGKFDHSKTGWTLTGSHTVPPRACTDCHVNNNYNITNTACVSCHQNDYNQAKSPVDHVAAKFPTTCEMCHDTVNWMNGKFDHASTGWTLTGNHQVPPRACTDCHVNNNYNLTDTKCYTCHKKDYDSTTNPNHAAAHFPTTCETCHDTSDWMNAKFDHKYFPMNHGGAGGVCATCHTNPNDYSVFTCTNCHTKSKTDQQHQGNSKYVYNSINCYQCHPTGKGG